MFAGGKIAATCANNFTQKSAIYVDIDLFVVNEQVLGEAGVYHCSTPVSTDASQYRYPVKSYLLLIIFLYPGHKKRRKYINHKENPIPWISLKPIRASAV